jgi:hypothetical protein
MLLSRTISYVAAGCLILLTCVVASGQGTLEGFQLFAPADVSSYGRGPQPNEGFFFSYDALYWTFSPPRVTTIGKEGLTRTVVRPVVSGGTLADSLLVQHNEVDTGSLVSEFDLGNRIEFGRIADNRGWMVSMFQFTEFAQDVTAHNADVTVETPAYNGTINALTGYVDTVGGTLADLPLTFTNLLARQVNSAWGIEADYVGRSEQLHNGGFFEWYLGPRYIEFDDALQVNAQGGVLDASQWTTNAQNHIIAGQIGGRWWKKLGRWMLSSEARGLAGLNCQNVHQFGFIGSNITPGGVGAPVSFGPSEVDHNEFMRVFTPGLELRIEGRYQITRSVSIRAGWNALWLNNVARGSDMINYTLDPEHSILGIVRDNNKDNVLMNGLQIGIDINR